MSDVSLSVRRRTEHGKQAAKRARRSGWTPAIIYGGAAEPEPVQVETQTLETLLRHRGSLTSVIPVTVEGGEDCSVLMRAPVRHPVTDKLLHVNLMRVTERSRVTVEVPVELIGECRGAMAGGVLDHVLHTLQVDCLAGSIPESIRVDVTNLDINDHVQVGDLDVAGVTFHIDRTATIVTVSPPRVEAEAAEGEEAAEKETAEPEVIGARASDEDEGHSDGS